MPGQDEENMMTEGKTGLKQILNFVQGQRLHLRQLTQLIRLPF
jgi:hypothetical protein